MSKVSKQQRDEILRLLAAGHDRDTISAQVGVTPGQVSAIGAHVTMGTYNLDDYAPDFPAASPASNDEVLVTTENLLDRLNGLVDSTEELPDTNSEYQVVIGEDAETGETVTWNPDPETGSANPHVLVLGESGFGKTYSLFCLLTELAQQGVTSIVFDYAQGFSLVEAPKEFIAYTDPVEINAGRDGVNINPLQPFPFDINGPVSVAQRVADTFKRVYSGIGVQQHAIIRQAVLDVFADHGIKVEDPKSWRKPLPRFAEIATKLDSFANDTNNPNRRQAASVASHISTIFVFNTFRPNGQDFGWGEMLKSGGRVFVIQLKGLEHTLEKAVTEFLLWNFIGYVDSIGPGPLRCFTVLDEAHNLSFDAGSPCEKLLREGRKFGLGLILASQQPEDFSSVAFSNTATKMVFQIGDESSTVSRQIHRKIKNDHTFADIYQTITKLPRGVAYVVTNNVGRVTKIQDIESRVKRWIK